MIPRTIHELIDRRAEEMPGAVAIRFSGTSLSYGALVRRSSDLAALLVERGIGRGSRLGILMGNRPEWLFTAIAAARVGALFVPLSTFLRDRELERTLSRAEVDAVVFAPRFSGTSWEEMLHDCVPRLGKTVDLLAWADDDEWPRPVGRRVGARHPVVPATGDDAAVVFFTSGSTSEPKGVVHSHAPMIRHGAAIAARMGVGPDDRSWSTFPFFFSAGIMIYAWSGFAAGATLVLQEKFEPSEALRLVQSERCTVYQGWPHQFEAMMAEPAFRSADLRSVRKANGARFLPHDAFLGHAHDAIDGWGMTETLTYCCSTWWNEPLDVRLASHGRPLDGVEIRVIDPETGEALPPDAEGELAVRGYNLMRGYLDAPEGGHLDADRFFHSGDLGRIDACGNVHFLGRLKDVIKTAGVNVASAEIEALIASHPAVESAHVVGVPDASRGERIVAFVVRSAPCTAEELAEHVARQTARFKVPSSVEFLERDQLPQTPTGKVDKKRLRGSDPR